MVVQPLCDVEGALLELRSLSLLCRNLGACAALISVFSRLLGSLSRLAFSLPAFLLFIYLFWLQINQAKASRHGGKGL